jgi:hypothetical protein
MRHKTAREALSSVSYLFLFVGIIALAEMIRHAAQGSLHFNFGVLGIGIFFGLRRCSKMWRYCALLFSWYGIITVCIALYICLNGQPPSAKLLFNSQRMSNLRPSSLSIPLLMVLFVTFWQYRILTHPAIRRLFNEDSRPAAPDRTTEEAPIAAAVVKQ